jgi:quercetin dioxygenase-like cupin family protein
MALSMNTGALITFLLCGVLGVSAEQAPQVKVTPIMTTMTTATGQPIVLPKGNAEVRVSMYDIAVGARLAVHKHPFHRYAYVLAGTLRVADKDNVQTFVYSAGDFLIEMVDTWHYGEVIGTEPVRLLVIDQVEPGQESTIPFN